MPTLAVSGTVLQGLRSPRALVLDVLPSEDVTDLSVVTAASLKVWRRGGQVEEWECAISNQSASGLTLTHPWVAGDNDIAGEKLRIYAQLTIADAVVEAHPILVTVEAR